MSVFQIRVLENEGNIPSSTCWNSLRTLWSHLYPLLKDSRHPLSQPAEILRSASLGCPGCRREIKSRSSHSSGLQKPSRGQRVGYKAGGWRDIFGPNWMVLSAWRALQVQWQYSEGETSFRPGEKLPHPCCDTTLTALRLPGGKAALMLTAPPPSQLHPFVSSLGAHWLPLFSQPAVWGGLGIWQSLTPPERANAYSNRSKVSSCS